MEGHTHLLTHFGGSDNDSPRQACLQNGKLSGCRLEALARTPGNQLSPLLDRLSKIIPDGMETAQRFESVCLVRLDRG
jgi:hypothetical protein